MGYHLYLFTHNFQTLQYYKIEARGARVENVRLGIDCFYMEQHCSIDISLKFYRFILDFYFMN